MRALIQRVAEARVKVGERVTGQIGPGLLVFLGVMEGDEEKDFDFLLRKILAMRIFPDENGRMNLSVEDVKGQILLVSQFTLCADTTKGNRPSFIPAANPNMARIIYVKALAAFKESGLTVASGEFGADMKVELINDGPVTLWLDSQDA